MSQRNSGHIRREHDLYETEPWVITEGLVPHFPVARLKVCEPACGKGKMVAALEAMGANVAPSDLHKHGLRKSLHLKCATRFRQVDFLKMPLGEMARYDAIITNPPYENRGQTAEAFIRHALAMLERYRFDRMLRWCAFLLNTNFDAAGTRAPLFDSPHFAARIVLRRRIEWFERGPDDDPPSENHAWFVWSSHARRAGQAAQTLYAPLGGRSEFSFLSASRSGPACPAITVEMVDEYRSLDGAVRIRALNRVVPNTKVSRRTMLQDDGQALSAKEALRMFLQDD